MVSYPLSATLVKIGMPTREEIRAMLTSTPIAVTVAICVTLVSLALIGAVVFLAWANRDSSMILTLAVGVLGAVGLLLSKIRALHRAVDEIKQNQGS